MTATGEPVKIDTLNFTLTANGNTFTAQGLRNFRILVNGGQVGSTISLPLTTSTAITTNFTVNPGTTTTVEARADIATSGATAVACGYDFDHDENGFRQRYCNQLVGCCKRSGCRQGSQPIDRHDWFDDFG
jgi:hypothetical protein